MRKPNVRIRRRDLRSRRLTLVFACGATAVAAGCSKSDPAGPGIGIPSSRTLSFRAPIDFAIAGTDVAIGDLDGDGSADIAVADRSLVSVLMNRGDGTFATAVTYPASPDLVALAIGDLNGDGFGDLALADRGHPPREGVLYDSGRVSVLMNNGDGTFGAAADYLDAYMPVSLALGDVDGSSGTDIVFAAGDFGGTDVLLNRGDGRFTDRHPIDPQAGGSGGGSLALGDLNGDGLVDIAVGGVFVLSNNGDGTFASVFYYLEGAGSQTASVIGDLNGDGKPDLAVASVATTHGQGEPITDGTVNVLLNNGDGTLAPAVSYPGRSPLRLARADLDTDGIPDLVIGDVSGDSGVSVRLNDGHGGFAGPRTVVTAYLSSMAVGDLNGDGKTDLAVVGLDGLHVVFNDSH